MANEKEIIRNTSIFTTIRYTAYFFTILTGLVLAKVLGPAAFGVYSALMIIVNYSHHSHFGLFHAMIKKVPFYNGKKEYTKAKEIEKITFSGMMIFILIISIALVIVSFFIKNFNSHTINSLRIVAVLIIAQQIFYDGKNFIDLFSNPFYIYHSFNYEV